MRHQGLHCLLRSKHTQQNIITIWCDPFVCTMNHPQYIVSNKIEGLISIQRLTITWALVNHQVHRIDGGILHKRDFYVLWDETSIRRDLLDEPNIYVSWSTSEIRVRLVPSNMCKPSGIFLTDRSNAVLLLCILFVICVSFFLIYCLVCSLQTCGHLLGKGWPLGSLVCDVFFCFSHFTIWYLGSGVILDCIDSWSLPSSILWLETIQDTDCIKAIRRCRITKNRNRTETRRLLKVRMVSNRQQ